MGEVGKLAVHLRQFLGAGFQSPREGMDLLLRFHGEGIVAADADEPAVRRESEGERLREMRAVEAAGAGPAVPLAAGDQLGEDFGLDPGEFVVVVEDAPVLAQQLLAGGEAKHGGMGGVDVGIEARRVEQRESVAGRVHGGEVLQADGGVFEGELAELVAFGEGLVGLVEAVGAVLQFLVQPADLQLGLLAQVGHPHIVNNGGVGGEQGFEQLDDGRIVSVRPVRDADHADQLAAVPDGHAEEGIQRRVTRGQAAPAGIGGGGVGNHRLAGGEGGAEEGLQIAELEALRVMLVEEGAHLVVPRDVGDGLGLEIGLPGRIVEHLGHKSVVAVGVLEQELEQPGEGGPAAVLHEVAGEQFADGGEQVVHEAGAAFGGVRARQRFAHQGLRPLGPGDAGLKIPPRQPQLQLDDDLAPEPRQGRALIVGQVARDAVDHAQRADAAAVRRDEGCPGVKPDVRGARHQGIVDKPGIQGGIGDLHHLGRADGVVAERQLPRGLGGGQADPALEPLPVGIEEGDERNGRAANLRSQDREVVEHVFRGRIQNFVALKLGEALELGGRRSNHGGAGGGFDRRVGKMAGAEGSGGGGVKTPGRGRDYFRGPSGMAK